MREKTFLGLKISGIYKVTLPSGKFYIGQSKNIKKRFQSYKYLKCSGQKIILQSLIEHGFDKHLFEVIEMCPVEQLLEREMFYIEKYQANMNRYPNSNGINATDGGTGSKGFKHSIEALRKMSAIQSAQVRSPESNKKRSETLKGRPAPINLIKKLKGVPKTEEHKRKLVAVHLKPVVDISTNIIYPSIKDAAEKLSINRATLAGWLCGDYKNKSNLRYLSEVKGSLALSST